MNRNSILKFIINIGNIILAIIYYYCMNEINAVFIQKIWAIQIVIPIALEVFAGKKDFFTPYSIYTISILMFLWSRPIINCFSTVDMVLAGTGQTGVTVLTSMLFLGLSFSLVNIFYLLFQQSNISVIRFEKKFQINSKLIDLFFITSLILVIIFWVLCIKDISIIKNSNYLSIAGSFTIEARIFSLSKYCLILWLVLSDSENRFYKASCVMLFGAFGYLCIGLRGYFVMYFLLWIFFQNKKKPFKLFSLTVIGLLILLMASVILEYRVGFQISNGIINKIKDAFYNQGASFEVVFGVTNFYKELQQLLPIETYFKIHNFGDYVDSVRNVNFVQGGFASSFFAEIFYLGGITTVIFNAVIAFIISFLQKASSKLSCDKSDLTGLLFFVLIANLSYIARSSAWSFINRFLLCLIIMYFTAIVKVQFRKNTVCE